MLRREEPARFPLVSISRTAVQPFQKSDDIPLPVGAGLDSTSRHGHPETSWLSKEGLVRGGGSDKKVCLLLHRSVVRWASRKPSLGLIVNLLLSRSIYSVSWKPISLLKGTSSVKMMIDGWMDR